MTLELGRFPVSKLGLKEFARFKKLTTLNLNVASLRDVDPEEFRNLSAVKSLRLNFINDAILRELGKLNNLTELAISGNMITDRGLRQLNGLTNLTSLSVTEANITDEGVKELCQLRNLTNLKLRSSLITKEAVKELHTALPNLVIER